MASIRNSQYWNLGSEKLWLAWLEVTELVSSSSGFRSHITDARFLYHINGHRMILKEYSEVHMCVYLYLCIKILVILARALMRALYWRGILRYIGEDEKKPLFLNHEHKEWGGG